MRYWHTILPSLLARPTAGRSFHWLPGHEPENEPANLAPAAAGPPTVSSSLVSVFTVPLTIPSQPPSRAASGTKDFNFPHIFKFPWLGRAGHPHVGHMDHTQRVGSLKQPWEKHRAALRSFTARLPFGHIATQHPIQVSPHIEERLSSANNNHTETGQVLYTSLLWCGVNVSQLIRVAPWSAHFKQPLTL